jgi:hypothetical protein
MRSVWLWAILALTACADVDDEDDDLDQDGVANQRDACPREAGSGPDGCPDIGRIPTGPDDPDMDGVPSSIDRCWDIPGPVANMGCPYPGEPGGDQGNDADAGTGDSDGGPLQAALLMTS